MTRKEEIETLLIQMSWILREALLVYSREDDVRNMATKTRIEESLATFDSLELTAPESSPAPLSDDTLLWDIIGDMLFPTVIPKWKDKVRQFKSKFILTRRTEGKGRTEGDLQE